MIRTISRAEFDTIDRYKFTVVRNERAIQDELESRNIAVAFGCPKDFEAVSVDKSFYIVQDFYCNESLLPFKSDFLSKIYGDQLLNYITFDDTVLYSHMLETLLNSIDNPGSIFFNDGLTVKYAIYDREYGPKVYENIEEMLKNYNFWKKKLLVKYNLSNLSFYEKKFISILEKLQLSSKFASNAKIMKEYFVNFDMIESLPNVEVNPVFEILANGLSSNALTAQILNWAKFEFFPPPSVSECCSALNRIKNIPKFDLPKNRVFCNTQIRKTIEYCKENIKFDSLYKKPNDMDKNEFHNFVLDDQINRFFDFKDQMLNVKDLSLLPNVPYLQTFKDNLEKVNVLISDTLRAYLRSKSSIDCQICGSNALLKCKHCEKPYCSEKCQKADHFI